MQKNKKNFPAGAIKPLPPPLMVQKGRERPADSRLLKRRMNDEEERFLEGLRLRLDSDGPDRGAGRHGQRLPPAAFIQVEDGVGITLNGARFTPRDADGKEVSVFLYNGTTYVPVRAISEAMGMDVSFNSATRTVVLTTADRTASQQGSTAASGDYISADRAKQIALNDAGVKESAAVFLRANLDWDDGRMKYEVEFYSGNAEYDYDIDAVTGAILSSDRDLEDFQIWNSGTSTNRPTNVSSGSSGSTVVNYITGMTPPIYDRPGGVLTAPPFTSMPVRLGRRPEQITTWRSATAGPSRPTGPPPLISSNAV